MLMKVHTLQCTENSKPKHLELKWVLISSLKFHNCRCHLLFQSWWLRLSYFDYSLRANSGSHRVWINCIYFCFVWCLLIEADHFNKINFYFLLYKTLKFEANLFEAKPGFLIFSNLSLLASFPSCQVPAITVRRLIILKHFSSDTRQSLEY